MWKRLWQVLSRKRDREFSVKVRESAHAVTKAKVSERNMLAKLTQLELAIKNGSK